MIAAIIDGSTLGDNLITGYQVDYMSLALIPAEAFENDLEHITSCGNKVGSIMIMSECKILLKLWV